MEPLQWNFRLRKEIGLQKNFQYSILWEITAKKENEKENKMEIDSDTSENLFYLFLVEFLIVWQFHEFI